MLTPDIFVPLVGTAHIPVSDGCSKERRYVERDAYERHLPANDVLRDYRRNYRGGRYAYTLSIDGATYTYSKAHFWVGGYARCYIGHDVNGAWVAVKEMRRTRYLYEDNKKATKPRKMSDSAIMKEHDACSRLGMSLRPIAAACTPTKAYMVLPLAHQSAFDLAMSQLKRGKQIASAPPLQQNKREMDGFLFALLRDVCGHLAKIHETGTIHNDVKMNNIVFCIDGTRTGHFELLDFGMSYAAGEGEQQGPNVFYGAPEARLNQSWFDLLEAPSGSEQACKQDSFALGLSCLWVVLGGGEAFDQLLPTYVCGDSTGELDLAYRAFEYARREAFGDGSHQTGAYPGIWAEFQSREPGVAERYRAVWRTLKERVSPGLAEVIAQLLAFDPESRVSAAQVGAKLAQTPVASEELRARRACAEAEGHALVKRHLRAASAAMAETSQAEDIKSSAKT